MLHRPPDRLGGACFGPGGRRPLSAKQWEELAEAVRRRPIALPDGTIYTYDFLIGDAAGAMYAPEVWPEAAELFDALEDFALGDQDAGDRAVSARPPCGLG